MPFNIEGLQYFGKVTLFNNGSDLQANFTEIYNNTGFTFAGGYIAGSTSSFPIQCTTSGFNFADYDYSITFTPINLVQSSNPSGLIPYYLNQNPVTGELIHVEMYDYQAAPFEPDAESDSIENYINIRIT
jgi:hypothetical protein